MAAFGRPRYRVRISTDPLDRRKAQRLRALAFRVAANACGLDGDRFDAHCRHILVEDIDSAEVLACFRLRGFTRAEGIGDSYSAQFHDLGRLTRYPQPMAEVGRFCVHPEHHDPDILRAAWAALARVVDAEGIGLLFGCTSFPGTDPEIHAQSFALLRQRYLGPSEWRPTFAGQATGAAPATGHGLDRWRECEDPQAAWAALPPLLRSYLVMGGWVGDTVVTDPEMETLHIFTALEVASIPAARARALRRLAI